MAVTFAVRVRRLDQPNETPNFILLQATYDGAPLTTDGKKPVALREYDEDLSGLRIADGLERAGGNVTIRIRVAGAAPASVCELLKHDGAWQRLDPKNPADPPKKTGDNGEAKLTGSHK